MDLLTFLRVIALVTNGVYCFIPRGEFQASNIKTIPLPMQQQQEQRHQQQQQQNVPANDISVYDPGVDSNLLNVAESDTADEFFTDENSIELNQMLENLREKIRSDESVAMKSAILLKLLEGTSAQAPLPILYVEDEGGDADEPNVDELTVDKRSGRYYRRYPWKRQNTRSRTRYEAESRYLCVPSREDVFKLLVGLHENRNGNNHKTVHFCNRKRPAKAIFTNIRFLG